MGRKGREDGGEGGVAETTIGRRGKKKDVGRGGKEKKKEGGRGGKGRRQGGRGRGRDLRLVSFNQAEGLFSLSL